MIDPVENVEKTDPEFDAILKQAYRDNLPFAVVNERVFVIEPTMVRNSRIPLPNKIRGEVTLNVGRNDPCPCGSGKKFKKCCGRGI